MPRGRPSGFSGLKNAPRLRADVMALSDEAKRRRRQRTLERNTTRNLKRIKHGKPPQSIAEAKGDSPVLAGQKRVARTRLRARQIEEFGGPAKAAKMFRRAANADEKRVLALQRRTRKRP